jgi:hypothetical protein
MNASDLAEMCRATAEGYADGSMAHDLAHVERLIDDYYALPGNLAGGSLHIVLDDGNTGEDSIVYCQGYSTEAGDDAGYWLATVLLALTDEERDALLGLPYCGDCCVDLLPNEQHVCPAGSLSVSRTNGVTTVKGPS